MEGRRFDDLYTKAEKLGSGSSSEVYKCFHNESREEYAAKLIRIRPPFVRKFKKSKRVKIRCPNEERSRNEAEICKILKHQNVVKLLECFHEISQTAMVFELITGGQLLYDIVERTRYSERDAACCMKQIFEGIEYCHEKDVIHRDLKPANLLLTNKHNNTVVKIVDFGLAVQTGGVERQGYGVVGTRGYLAPEVILDREYGTPVDLWTCGLLLYMMLFGILPFYHANDVENQRRILETEYDLPETRLRLNDEARDLIARLLVKDQDTRITARDALNHSFFVSRPEDCKSRFHRLYK